MKIRYILGEIGSGKLTKCFEEMIQAENNAKNGILIVPNQFTLEAEKLFINKIDSKVSFFTEILSFKRLAFKIFSEMGLDNKVIIEKTGKLMILRKILNNLLNQKKLTYFTKNSCSNIGILERISNTIQELFECDVNLQTFENSLQKLYANENINPQMIEKLNDIKIIFQEFKNFIEKEYICNDEILTILGQKIKESNLFKKKKTVWIYGFNGFSLQEFNVIKEIIKKAEKVNICFNYNCDNINITDLNIFDPLYNIKKTIKNLNYFCKSIQNVEIEQPIFLNQNFRHKNNEELLHLNQNYFKYNFDKFQKNTQNIQIFSAQNKFLEIEKVAQNISYFVKYKGYRYNQIAVILSDFDYADYIKSIFNKYNIPYFLDYKKDINSHILIQMILAVFDIIIYNWQYEDIFKYIKSGFLVECDKFDISEDDLYNLENYVLKYGIKNHLWNKEFKYGFFENSIYQKDSINNSRLAILNSLKKFDFKANKKYKVIDISKKLFDFLIDLQVDKTLNKWENQNKQIFLNEISFNSTNLDINVQIWNKICEIIQKFVDILGDEEITIEEYSKILKAGFNSEKIGILPPTQDQVLIGDFERTRLSEIKILFCMAMNEGIIPKYKESENFISDTERVLLINDLELKPISNIKLATDDFQIYSTILKSKEKVIFSYALSDFNGKTKKPSSIILKISKIFPFLNIFNIDKIQFEKENIYSKDAMFENIFEFYPQINKNSQDYLFFQNIFYCFLNNPKYFQKLNKINYSIQNIKNQSDIFIKNEFIEKLYDNKKILTSVTKLEQFKKCPFSYFIKYNINAKERDILKFEAVEFGEIYHLILKDFFNQIIKIYKNNFDISKISYDEILKILDNSIKKIKDFDNIKNLFDLSAKYSYYFKRIKKISLMSVLASFEQLKLEKFFPDDLEVSFGELSGLKNSFDYIEIDLENSYKMLLKGKIDRVDKLKNNNAEFYKIIDYKSSENTIKEEEIFYGIKLQLFIYLSSLIKNKKLDSDFQILPSAVLYFQIKEDIENDKYSLNQFLKNYKFYGFIEESTNKKGELGDIIQKNKSKKIKAIDKNQFEALLKLSDIVAKEIGLDISNGNINIKPYKYNKKTGCDYCEYKSICKFDIIENDYNYFKSLNDYEIWQIIDKKINDK